MRRPPRPGRQQATRRPQDQHPRRRVLHHRARGFHVIAPTDRKPWTHDIFKPSRRLALLARAALVKKGFPRANYIAGGDGLDFRSDLGTLNLSNVPTVMVECGNMKSAADARLMTSSKGQRRYAAALARAVRLFLR